MNQPRLNLDTGMMTGGVASLLGASRGRDIGQPTCRSLCYSARKQRPVFSCASALGCDILSEMPHNWCMARQDLLHHIEPAQSEGVSGMHVSIGAGEGILVLPCGRGKSIVKEQMSAK